MRDRISIILLKEKKNVSIKAPLTKFVHKSLNLKYSSSFSCEFKIRVCVCVCLCLPMGCKPFFEGKGRKNKLPRKQEKLIMTKWEQKISAVNAHEFRLRKNTRDWTDNGCLFENGGLTIRTSVLHTAHAHGENDGCK